MAGSSSSSSQHQTSTSQLFLAVVAVAVVAATAFLAGSSWRGGCLLERLQPAAELHLHGSHPRFAAAAGAAGSSDASSSRRSGPTSLPDADAAAEALAASSRDSADDSSSSSDDSSSSSSPQPGYVGMSEHPACAFLRSGASNVQNEHGWGDYDQCDMSAPFTWLKRTRSNCYSCYDGSNVCTHPPELLYHQYLERLHPTLWEGNLLSMRAFLMTQDLRHARMIVWAPDPDRLTVPNKTAEFFAEFSDHISLRRFDYEAAIAGTPFEGHPFFGNGSRVKHFMPHAGSFSDIVRILILNKYGGFWMDNDVVLYQDLTHLLATSYQFVMRWMNLHIMRMHKGSPLMARALQVATTLPLDHPDFKESIIEKTCKPNGYYQIVAERYGFTDIYNGCLFRLLLRHNNSGPDPSAVLYDLPLGWFDHDWKGCFGSRKNISDVKWREVATHFLAMHNRYPTDPALGADTPNVQDTPLSRVLRTVGGFFAACNTSACLPHDGMSIVAYDAFDPTSGLGKRPKSSGGRRRALQQLQQQQQQGGAGDSSSSSSRRQWAVVQQLRAAQAAVDAEVDAAHRWQQRRKRRRRRLLLT